MNNTLQEVASKLLQDRVPSVWLKKSYKKSLDNVDGYVCDLNKRI